MTSLTDPAQAAAPRNMDLRGLTGLRFVAAFLVLGYHASVYLVPIEQLRRYLGFGYAGVGLFFVLSGFVLTWTYASPGRNEVRYGEFMFRRFARIWPLHFFLVLVSAVVLLATAQRPEWISLLPTVLLMQAWLPGRYGIAFNGVSWSLSCELFFYACFPKLASLSLNVRFKRGMIAAIVFQTAMLATVIAVLPRMSWNFLTYTDPIFRLGEFVVGIFLARAVMAGHRLKVPVRPLGLALLALPIAACAIYSGFADVRRLPFAVADMVLLPFWICVIAAVASADLENRSNYLSSRTLVRWGQRSFALYLVQEITFVVAYSVVDENRLHGVPAILLVSCTLVMIFLLSAVLHRLVEKPANRWLLARRPVAV